MPRSKQTKHHARPAKSVAKLLDEAKKLREQSADIITRMRALDQKIDDVCDGKGKGRQADASSQK